MKSYKLLSAVLISVVAISAKAMPPQPVYAATAPGVATQAEHPGAVLKQGIDKLVHFLDQSGGDPRKMQGMEAFLNAEIAPYFDFEYMTQWAGGARYPHMNDEQRAQMQTALKGLFMGAMMQKLASYQHGQVRFMRPRGNPRSGEVTLGIQIYPAQGMYPTRLDFRMYRSTSGWKVFDVSANGQSAVVYYRNYFAQQMRGYGQGYGRGYGQAYGQPGQRY